LLHPLYHKKIPKNDENYLSELDTDYNSDEYDTEDHNSDEEHDEENDE
jgi:hypothetical protein